MAQFPFFRDVAGAKVLVVGGGEVALRRAQALADSGAEVTVVSLEFCEGFEQAGVRCIRRSFAVEDLNGAAIVIAATSDRTVNAAIGTECRRRGIEVNVSDAPQECTFHFPSLVRRGSLTVGISTDGTSPVAAKYVRRQIEAAIPEHFEEVLSCMEVARGIARKHIENTKMRAKVLRGVFEYCLSAEAMPDECALEEWIRSLLTAETD